MSERVVNAGGREIVLTTDGYWSRDAHYRGAFPMDLESLPVAADHVRTDQAYVEADIAEIHAAEPIEIAELNPKQQAMIMTLREIVGLVDWNNGPIRIMATAMLRPHWRAIWKGKEIFINTDYLRDYETALDCIIHELAHIEYGQYDCTEYHTGACTRVGARLFIANYLREQPMRFTNQDKLEIPTENAG